MQRITMFSSLAIARNLLVLGLVSVVGTVNADIVTLDSTKESHIRQSEAGTNQGQARLIFGAQGTGSEFRTMVQFSLDDLVADTGGGPITVDSVSLDSGDAFAWNGGNSSNSFSVRAWDVDDFNVGDNNWSDPQGSAGADGAGGTLGTSLSTATFGSTTPEGDFIFTDSAAFTSFLQSAYDSYTPGDNLNFLLISNDTSLNTIPRTDTGAVNGIGTADLVVNYTTAVPEPSSLALLGLGLVGLVARRRKV